MRTTTIVDLPILNDDECSCTGRSLDKLLQPAVLTVLAREDLHGYVLVQRLSEMSMCCGSKPDATGVYRTLRRMEEQRYVSSTWDTSDAGPAKRLYTLTAQGVACLATWTNTLNEYHAAIGRLLADMRECVDFAR